MGEPRNNYFNKYLLVIIPVSLAVISILYIFDFRLWQAARNLLNQDTYYITDLITTKGLFLFYAAFIVLFGFAAARKNRSLLQVCLAYLKAQLVFAFALVRILKIILGRARPGHGDEFTFFSFAFRYNSFPSGHSADAFVSGVFLYYLLKHSRYSACRFLPLLYACVIAVSRVFISSHYPSDVAAGMMIGILGAWFFISRLNGRTDNPESTQSSNNN